MRLNDAATATLTIAFDSVVVLPPFDDGLLWKRLERAAVALLVIGFSADLFHFNFYASVLGATFRGPVIGDRFAFAKTLSGNAAAVDALLHHVVFNRIDPSL